MRRNRSRMGTELIPANEVAGSLRNGAQEKSIISFIDDQAPPSVRKGQWIRFLNQDTLVNPGMERLAVITNRPVIFVEIKKLKRGYYEIRLVEIAKNPSRTQPMEITERFNKANEDLIRQYPEYWLWSHRRWKHKRVSPTEQLPINLRSVAKG